MASVLKEPFVPTSLLARICFSADRGAMGSLGKSKTGHSGFTVFRRARLRVSPRLRNPTLSFQSLLLGVAQQAPLPWGAGGEHPLEWRPRGRAGRSKRVWGSPTTWSPWRKGLFPLLQRLVPAATPGPRRSSVSSELAPWRGWPTDFIETPVSPVTLALRPLPSLSRIPSRASQFRLCAQGRPV